MSNITEQEIEKLAEDWLYSLEETNPQVLEKKYPLKPMEFGFIAGYKAALQNKVSDVSAEEIELEAQRRYAILEKYNNLDGFMKREAFKNGAEWYASIVNEKNENIPADFK